MEIEINKIKQSLKEKFTITDISLVDNIQGIKFVKEKDCYILHQLYYLEKLLRKFNIEKCKPVNSMTPEDIKELRIKKI